jgi:hypothetical protein
MFNFKYIFYFKISHNQFLIKKNKKNKKKIKKVNGG